MARRLQQFTRFIQWIQTEHQAAINPQTKPTDLGCESACRLPSCTPTISTSYDPQESRSADDNVHQVCDYVSTPFNASPPKVSTRNVFKECLACSSRNVLHGACNFTFPNNLSKALKQCKTYIHYCWCLVVACHQQHVLQEPAVPYGRVHCLCLTELQQPATDPELQNNDNKQWVTLSFRNTKVLHKSVTPNLKSNCWTLV